ncbi:hypothetical protein [Nostoc sp.]|uniref:hypothetical protein n=1 Tax=Nostoc sp. TaxID=1180 RepID=UPI002FFB2DEA
MLNKRQGDRLTGVGGVGGVGGWGRSLTPHTPHTPHTPLPTLCVRNPGQLLPPHLCPFLCNMKLLKLNYRGMLGDTLIL